MNTRTGINGTGRYYIINEETGLAYPSVTTIIGEMSDKSGLVEWEKRVGKEEADRISKFSANRGTYMHQLHENYIELKYNQNNEKALQIAFQQAREQHPYLTNEEIDCGKDLFFNFLNRSDFYKQIKRPLFQEVGLWSSKGGGYAGRVDLVKETISNLKKVVDFKTSKRPKNEEWILGYKKQIAAYSVALYERHGIFPDQGEIWISCETGDVQTFVLTQNDIKDYFALFVEDVKGYHAKHPNN